MIQGINNSLTQGMGAANSPIGFSTPKLKRTIYIKEVENGWTIHYNTSNYPSGEEIRVAKDFDEVQQVLQEIAVANKLE